MQSETRMIAESTTQAARMAAINRIMVTSFPINVSLIFNTAIINGNHKVIIANFSYFTRISQTKMIAAA